MPVGTPRDRDDVLFLLKFLGLKHPKDVFTIIKSYYSNSRISPKTQFLLEELLVMSGVNTFTAKRFLDHHQALESLDNTTKFL